MFTRFGKKAPLNQAMPEESASVPPEEETCNVDSTKEIEQARQDLMRAAMEAVAIPAAETGSKSVETNPSESDDADIPVIHVKVTKPPKPKSEPESPAKPVKPVASKKTITPAEPVVAPVKPVIMEPKKPEITKAEPAQQKKLPEVAPAKPKPTVVVPDKLRIAQLDDIMIDIVQRDIASHRQRISRST